MVRTRRRRLSTLAVLAIGGAGVAFSASTLPVGSGTTISFPDTNVWYTHKP